MEVSGVSREVMLLRIFETKEWPDCQLGQLTETPFNGYRTTLQVIGPTRRGVHLFPLTLRHRGLLSRRFRPTTEPNLFVFQDGRPGVYETSIDGELFIAHIASDIN